MPTGEPGRRCGASRPPELMRPLVVSHEMVGRMLLRNLAGLDVRTALACGHPHDVVYRVRIGEARYERLPAEDSTTTGELP